MSGLVGSQTKSPDRCSGVRQGRAASAAERRSRRRRLLVAAAAAAVTCRRRPAAVRHQLGHAVASARHRPRPRRDRGGRRDGLGRPTCRRRRSGRPRRVRRRSVRGPVGVGARVTTAARRRRAVAVQRRRLDGPHARRRAVATSARHVVRGVRIARARGPTVPAAAGRNAVVDGRRVDAGGEVVQAGRRPVVFPRRRATTTADHRAAVVADGGGVPLELVGGADHHRAAEVADQRRGRVLRSLLGHLQS